MKPWLFTENMVNNVTKQNSGLDPENRSDVLKYEFTTDDCVNQQMIVRNPTPENLVNKLEAKQTKPHMRVP